MVSGDGNVPWGCEAWQLRLQCQRLGRHTCGDRSCNCRRRRAAPREDKIPTTPRRVPGRASWEEISLGIRVQSGASSGPSSASGRHGRSFQKCPSSVISKRAVHSVRCNVVPNALIAQARESCFLQTTWDASLRSAAAESTVFQVLVHARLSAFTLARNLFYFNRWVPSTPLTCRHLVCATR